MQLNKTRFESLLNVRPDDIDMNQHVHSSRYIDYVLTARYDQMERCYKMPMSEFIQHGFGWVIRDTFLEFKRPLLLGEQCRIITWLDEMENTGCRVCFEILKTNGKQSCTGYFNYTMVSLQTGRAHTVPDWIIERYSI